VTDALFLPGASGSREYWHPVIERLSFAGRARVFGWPGFDGLPPDRDIKALSDLPGYVSASIHTPVDLIAQSMGGVVALLVALQRPELVRRLVLCGTSGGIDLASLGAEDWRPGYAEDLPEKTPRWFVDDRSDLRERLPLIQQEALLLWGEQDTISPPAVGRYLCTLMPNASFATVRGATHMVAAEQPAAVAARIEAFLSSKSIARPGASARR
jgi:pimeloyl-ACP methyl ester carboxylesterase